MAVVVGRVVMEGEVKLLYADEKVLSMGVYDSTAVMKVQDGELVGGRERNDQTGKKEEKMK